LALSEKELEEMRAESTLTLRALQASEAELNDLRAKTLGQQGMERNTLVPTGGTSTVTSATEGRSSPPSPPPSFEVEEMKMKMQAYTSVIKEKNLELVHLYEVIKELKAQLVVLERSSPISLPPSSSTPASSKASATSAVDELRQLLVSKTAELATVHTLNQQYQQRIRQLERSTTPTEITSTIENTNVVPDQGGSSYIPKSTMASKGNSEECRKVLSGPVKAKIVDLSSSTIAATVLTAPATVPCPSEKAELSATLQSGCSRFTCTTSNNSLATSNAWSKKQSLVQFRSTSPLANAATSLTAPNENLKLGDQQQQPPPQVEVPVAATRSRSQDPMSHALRPSELPGCSRPSRRCHTPQPTNPTSPSSKTAQSLTCTPTSTAASKRGRSSKGTPTSNRFLGHTPTVSKLVGKSVTATTALHASTPNASVKGKPCSGAATAAASGPTPATKSKEAKPPLPAYWK
jgi:hypothetical protein